MTDHATTSVLWVTGAYFPEFSSGGLQCQAVARVLRGRVNGRVLTTAVDRRLPAREVIDGVEVSRIAVDISRSMRIGATLKLLAALLRAIPRVHVVHVQGFSSKNIPISGIAKLFRRPVVLHLQTSRHDEPETIEAQGAAAWWAYSTADLFISVSPSLTGPLKRRLPSAPLVEIPNAVDVERFTPATAAERGELRRELGLPAGDPIVLFVGVMMPDKQPDVLFDAWLRQQERSGRRSTLVFVGASNPKLFELGGQLGAQLSRRADELGVADRVKFLPPTRQVERFFRAADVFVLPSAREGLPVVLLEAMACGLPCIASRLPGSTDVVAEDGVSARLVPVGDVDAMASALDDVLGDPERSAAMGRAARDAVMRRYTVQHVAEQWSAAYQSLRRRS